MRPAERCAFCAETNLTWLDDDTPVCGMHFLASQGMTPDDQRVPRLRSRARARLSPEAERLLREAAE